MRERPTARVLLFDPDGQLLLMKGRLPSNPTAQGAWFTVGGGVEPGETVMQAAAREVGEETGFADVKLGPVVWRREGPLALGGGELVLFQEHYIVGRCAGGEPSREAWDALERALIDDIRWWSLAELQATTETVHPIGMLEHLPDVLAGRYPADPIVMIWR